MNIIITGSSGFVGQNLVPFLHQGDINVVSLNLRFDWRRSLPENYDAIIHLAGKAHDTSNISNPEEYFEVNTELTKKVFDDFLQSNARDFIYFSSVKAVADSVDGVLVEETDANPKTPYGKSKRKAEEYLLAQILPANKRLFILRPCMIHGPGNKGNLNLLYSLVSRGIPWPLGAFDNKRSFLAVENLCFIIHKLLTEDIKPGVYNVADSEPVSTNHLVRLIAETTGMKTRIWDVPKSLVYAIAKVGNVLPLPLNEERLQKLTESYVVSNAKLINALGCKLPVKAEDGLRHTLHTFAN